MKKTYAELLGGEVEDLGFDRFKLDDTIDQFDVLDDLACKADSVKLVEEQVKLGEVEVSLTDKGIPYFTLAKPYSLKQFYAPNEKIYFSPWSISQLSEKMGMGAAGYIKKCMYKNMNELVPLNLNKWAQKNKNKEVIFRYHPEKNILRAVVSDRYGFFDHFEVVDCLKDVYKTGVFNSLKLEAGFMSPDNLNLRIVSPEKVIIPGVGNNDGSTIGMCIRNGQTGQYSAEVEFMVYTFICSNGLFIGTDRSKVFSRKHYNIDKDQFTQDLLESVEKFPDYIAAVSGTLEKARGTRISSIFDPNTDDGVSFVKKQTGMSNDEVEEMIGILERDWDLSLWGLSGAVTQFAQTVGSSARQYQLEQSAGKILENGLRLVA